MDYQEIDDLQIMTGVDIPIPDLHFTIHQPRLWEIAQLGEEAYFIALSLFSTSKKSMKLKNDQITEWMIFQEILKQKIPHVKNIRTFMRNFIQLFVVSKVNLGPKSIMLDFIVGGDGEVKNIEESNFDIFKQYILKVAGAELLGDHEEEFHPINKRAQKIADKIIETRRRKAALKPKSSAKGFLKSYMKILSIGLGLSTNEIKELTLLQTSELIRTYMDWESYDLEVKSRLAGAKGDKELIHWSQRENDPGIGTI